MNKKLLIIFFAGIVALALFLRLWQLGNVPPSPDWDEAALGYDAYSIIHTGRDEFGKFLPVVLRSFDDYKPALYAYLSIPPVLAFGLNVFAVRFPSAVFGVISVISVFFLIRELFKNYKFKDYLSLLASFFLAISPWSLQFSRVGFESNVGDTLNILMALFFIKGLKKPWLLFLSVFFGGLAIYVYQGEKVFTPLLLLALIMVFWKKLREINKKYLTGAVILGILVVLPMVFYMIGNRESLLRVKGTSIFTYQTELLKTNTQKLERDLRSNNKIGLILDNRRIVYAKTIVLGYISHFDPNWLFITGDISRHHAPNMGLLYLFELPFIFIGIYMLIFGEFEKTTKRILLTWFLLAPVPASVTVGVPHAVRTLNFLPTWQIFAAIGAVGMIYAILNIKYKILKIQIKYLILALYTLFAIFNFSYYLNEYFVQQNYYFSQDWQYGYKQAIDVVKPMQGNFQKIVVSDKQPMDKSYMFFLFYLEYPPKNYQDIGKNSSGGFASHQAFGKYEFRPIDWTRDSLDKNTLYIGNPDEIPQGASFKTIYNLDGTPAIRIAKT
jgi:4-amino-4-deoxy-L-arabinose transferase-like glycosyltransferase